MKLSEGKNTEFELEIAGYQFPHLKNEPYDSDWLNITICVKHSSGSWTKTDPSLLTYEVEWLIEWLEAIAEGQAVESDICFTEPNLRFQLLDENEKKVRIYFELEYRPSWAESKFNEDEDEIWVEFSITPGILKKAAESLRTQLRKFPTRKGI